MKDMNFKGHVMKNMNFSCTVIFKNYPDLLNLGEDLNNSGLQGRKYYIYTQSHVYFREFRPTSYKILPFIEIKINKMNLNFRLVATGLENIYKSLTHFPQLILCGLSRVGKSLKISYYDLF